MRGEDVPVVACSALTGHGLAELWDTLRAERGERVASGARDTRRRAQSERWMWRLVEEELLGRLRRDASVGARATELLEGVRGGTTTPTAAARELVTKFTRNLAQESSG